MALIKLRNLPPSNPGDFTGQNLLAVALNDENLDKETKSFSCGQLISGMMMDFRGDAYFANFTEGLQVSGESVATGDISALTSVGGENILGENDDGDISFGGSDPDDKKDIIFTHGGDEKMKVHDNGVNVKPALTVNGLPVLTQGMNISLLTNNAGYITAASIPSNISEFNNDSLYITAAELPNLINVGKLTLKDGTTELGVFSSDVDKEIDIDIESKGYLTAADMPNGNNPVTLTLVNGTDQLGTFRTDGDNQIDINLPQHNEAEPAFIDSDERLKESLIRIDQPTVRIQRINGYNFIWNEDAGEEKAGEKDIGVLAQEVEQIIPEAVKEKDGKLKVAYHKIIPLLIECIKDQDKRIKKLEKKIK